MNSQRRINDQRPSLRPPQFGLRTLFAFVAGVCVLLALSKIIGMYATLVLLFLLFSIAAHIAGNALGTRLRDDPSPPQPHGHGGGAVHRPEELTDEHYSPTTKLSGHHALGITVVICVVVGVLTGGALGGWLLSVAVGDKATWGNISFGMGAFGVLGGIFGFLISSFVKVILAANAEGWKEEERARQADPRKKNDEESTPHS